MAAIPRSIDDIALDSIVSGLRAFEAAQIIENQAVYFAITRDRLTRPEAEELPLVNLWLEAVDPKGAVTKTGWHFSARFNADCLATGKTDEAAIARLYYLKEQVLHGLYRLSEADFGLGAGVIARKGWPRWTTSPQDIETEETVCAGRWTFEIEFEGQAEDITGTALDMIHVDAGRWQADYVYGT